MAIFFLTTVKKSETSSLISGKVSQNMKIFGSLLYKKITSQLRKSF